MKEGRPSAAATNVGSVIHVTGPGADWPIQAKELAEPHM